MNDQAEEETRENTASLEDLLVARLRAWLSKEGPRVHGDDAAAAEITFSLYAGEVGYLDDDTPYITAHVEEKTTADEIGGWIPARGREDRTQHASTNNQPV